jgi:GNAT superfamily N-acetyltransferase
VTIDAAVTIRPARPGDAPALVGVFAHWGYAEPAEVIAARLAEWERTEHAAVLVAELDGKVAGLVAVSASPHLALPGRFARVAGLAVEAGFRRRGVGVALVRAAEELSREWGCDRVEITSSRSRPEAPGFYPSLGYEDRSERQARFIRQL